MIKQVIVIRTKYPHPTEEGEFRKIRTGKLISQAAHASLKIFFDRMCPHYLYSYEEDDYGYERTYRDRIHGEYICTMTPEMEEWKEGAFTKICVYVDSEEGLLEVVEKAELAGLPVALITDSGKTEFNGVPTNTCCAIGPAEAKEIDKITGRLPLY
jgi:PTH2 family peptidyl-tRNA hydrolase